jgi:hypothetical protein
MCLLIEYHLSTGQTCHLRLSRHLSVYKSQSSKVLHVIHVLIFKLLMHVKKGGHYRLRLVRLFRRLVSLRLIKVLLGVRRHQIFI